MTDPRATPLRRLPGGRRHGPFRASCWMAEDHLVCVETSWFVERYRRFAFRDIESIVIQRNERARVWTILWIVFLLIGAAMALPPAADGTVRVLGALLAVPALLGLVINAMRGPCCATTLHTRVSAQDARAWRRLRTARQAVAELAAAVGTVQGALPDDSLAAAAGAGAATEPAAVPAPRPMPPPVAAAPAGPPRRRLIAACAAALLVEAAATAMAIGLRTAPMMMAVLGLSFLLFGLCATALVRGAGGRTTPVLRSWTWWLFGYLAVRGTVAYFWGLVRYMPAAVTGGGQATDWVVLLFDTWAADSRFLAVFFGLVSLLSATFGFMGILMALRSRGAGGGGMKPET